MAAAYDDDIEGSVARAGQRVDSAKSGSGERGTLYLVPSATVAKPRRLWDLLTVCWASNLEPSARMSVLTRHRGFIPVEKSRLPKHWEAQSHPIVCCCSFDRGR